MMVAHVCMTVGAMSPMVLAKPTYSTPHHHKFARVSRRSVNISDRIALPRPHGGAHWHPAAFLPVWVITIGRRRRRAA